MVARSRDGQAGSWSSFVCNETPPRLNSETGRCCDELVLVARDRDRARARERPHLKEFRHGDQDKDHLDGARRGDLALAGCGDDDETSPTEPGEEDLFTGYRDWNAVEHSNAPHDILGPAHQGSDPEFTRSIFTTAGGMIDSGEYPVGTVFVKETHTHTAGGDHAFADPMGLLGMVKRPAGFDDAGNDWEYFNIDPADLSVIASGADLGSCKGCHALAAGDEGQDRIFAHPLEFEPDPADFDAYATWNLIGTEQGPDPLLGSAHDGNDEPTVRRIYKKQLAANPSGLGEGYPTGTLLAKEVQDGDGEVIAITGMAKRGAGFDPDHDDWEYFMWDVETGDVAMRGAVAMCIGCHAGANAAGNGRDWVFAHDDDPFNN